MHDLCIDVGDDGAEFEITENDEAEELITTESAARRCTRDVLMFYVCQSMQTPN